MRRQSAIKLTVGIALAVLAVAVYWPWFTSGFIGYGDWWHNLPGRVAEIYHQTLVWDGSSNLGAGLTAGSGSNIIIYWVGWLYGFLQEVFHIPVSISVRLVWFLPYAFLSFFSAWYLGFTISKRQLIGFVTAIIYPLSTLVVLDIQGGHMTIALAYAVAPLIIGLLYKVLTEKRWSSAILLGMVFALQAVYDIRISYLTILVAVLMVLYTLLFVRRDWRVSRRAAQLLGVVGVVGLGLSAYWLIHMFIKPAGSAGALPAGYDDVSWLTTLSYAKIQNTFATNHVWWPWSEGVIMQIQPLFYLTVVLAVIGLTTWRKNRYIPFFFGIYLLGVFLAKGVNPPAGAVYAWLFQHVPGFSFFRDPAKFFTVVMIGIAPVAAYGVQAMIARVTTHKRAAWIAALTVLLLLPQYHLIFGARHGTFVTKQLPAEYQQLADWQLSQQDWGRVLWMPLSQRYVLGLQNQPALDYHGMTEGGWNAFVPTYGTGVATFLQHPYSHWLLQRVGVQYIGIPTDTEDEIYKYYNNRTLWQQQAAHFIAHTPLTTLQPIAVYPVNGAKDELYLAQTAVIADDAALQQEPDLPTLDDQDVLVQVEAGISTHAERVRSAVFGLRENKTDPGVWTLYVSQRIEGTTVLPTVLSGKRLTVDNLPVTAKSVLEAGWHTLKLDRTAKNTEPQQAAAQYVWHGCAPGQINPDQLFTRLSDGSITLQPMDGATPGCAIVDLGTLSAGVHVLSVEGTVQGAVVGTVVYSDENGQVNTIAELAQHTGEYQLSLTAPLQVQLIVRAAGSADGAAQIRYITDRRILSAVPHSIGMTVMNKPAAPVMAPVTWHKVSTREYQVTVPRRTEATYLILNQGFSTGWRLEGATPIVHLAVNGGINGWYLPAGDAVTVTVIYWYRWPYIVGTLITVLTLISTCIFLRKIYRHEP